MIENHIRIEQSLFKTVASVAWGAETLVMVFKDGKFAAVKAEMEYGELSFADMTPAEIEKDRDMPGLFLRAGLWTQERYDEWVSAQAAKAVDAERARYERLKVKFEG